jgi:hypothetical protein
MPIPSRSIAGLLTLLAISAGACSPGDTPVPGVVVRDSAGVTIVESGAPREAEPWGVEPEPVLSVGVAEGDERYLLSRVGDALLLLDGGVALVDGGSLQLRVYGPDGTFRAAAGRGGSGPGEFRALAGPLEVDGEGGFLLWDMQQRRITRLGPELDLRETILPEPVEGASGMLLRGYFHDGSMLMSEVRAATSMVAMGSRAFRDTLRLHRADTAGRPLGPVGVIPSAEGDIRVDGGPDPSTIRSVEIFRNPLSPAAHSATGEILVTGTGGAFQLQAAEPDGTPLWIARLDLPRRPVDAAAREAFIDAMTAGAPDPTAARAAYAQRPFPPHFPTFDQLVVDADGNSWMRAYRAPFDEGDARWHIVDGEGVWRADALLPGRLRVTRITADAVVGIHRDDLGVESVRVYRRAGGGTPAPRRGS